MGVIFAILLFSFLIFIHEFGHFISAKLSGVQVNEFSMFMGPAIFKKQVGETLYSLRCIPIGGYCAMEGEDEDTDNPRSFQKAAWWKRLIILFAGAAMNFIAGVLIIFVIFMPMKKTVVPVIDYFESYCTINGENGLREGDKILKIDGERIYSRSDIDLILNINRGDIHDVLVLRDGEKVFLDDFMLERHKTTDEKGKEVYRLGIKFAVKELSFLDRVKNSWNECLNTARTVRLSLQMLLTGKAGIRDMSGPVGIVHIMSDTASASETFSEALRNMLYFGGLLGINLAIMNLLPIPALDGGRIVCLLLTLGFEKITRKKIDPKYEGYLHAVGMVLLLALMAVIMFKDIFVIFKR